VLPSLPRSQLAQAHRDLLDGTEAMMRSARSTTPTMSVITLDALRYAGVSCRGERTIREFRSLWPQSMNSRAWTDGWTPSSTTRKDIGFDPHNPSGNLPDSRLHRPHEQSSSTGVPFLAAPDGRSTTCDRKLDGDALSCNDVAVDAQTLDELFAIDISLYGQAIEFTEEATDDEVALFTFAVSVLAANIDLVKWAMCWVGGLDSGYDLMNKLLGEAPPFKVKFVDDDKTFWNTGFKGKIHVHRGAPFYLDPLAMFSRRTPSGGRVRDASTMCGILDIAGSLFHEMTHQVGFAGPDPWPASNCYKSYLTENIFRWALYQRYPDAASSNCCAEIATDDSLWGDNITRSASNTGSHQCVD
jgi:hypothetical protein